MTSFFFKYCSSDLLATSVSQFLDGFRWADDPRLGLLGNRWFVLMMSCLVFMLTILLIMVRRFRLERDRNEMQRSFNEFSDRHGLTEQDRAMLSVISEKAGVKRKDSIFTIVNAFNRGAVKFMQEQFSASTDIEERKKINVMVNSIKGKLGFKKRSHSLSVRSSKSKGMSSRQLAVGKKVTIGRSALSDTRVSGVVERNDEFELAIRIDENIESKPGSIWNIQYRSGSSTWGFAALAISCEGRCLIVNHCDDIRFVNRRRFLRVAVSKTGYVAKFPISLDPHSKPVVPEFVPARITEMSGPGLRLEAELNVASGDRVLVVFEAKVGVVFQDIGEVRGVRHSGNGISMGVELIGLDEKAVDELVRVTNSSAINFAAEAAELEKELVNG